jgi:hypothetical protein
VLIVIVVWVAILTIVAIGVVVALLMGTDRRRPAEARPFQGLVRRSRQLNGSIFPESILTRDCSAAVPLDVPITADKAKAVAVAVLGKRSRRRIQEVAPWRWIGWSGMGWRSFGQELTIEVQSLDSASVRFVCGSCPRYEDTRVDWGASERAANSLAEGVRSLVARDP